MLVTEACSLWLVANSKELSIERGDEKEFIKSNLLHCLEAAASTVLPSALKGVRISLPQVQNVYILDLQHNRVLFLRHSIFPLYLAYF